MLAAFVSSPSPKDPLSVLEVGDRPDPEVPEGWTTVQVKAVSLNHHDLFSLRGIGLPAERMPMILGTDAAGLDEDGNEVVVHGVVLGTPGWTGDETLDPKRSLFSELHQGTMAEKVAVPRRHDRLQPGRGAQPGVLHPALGGRVHDGYPRRAAGPDLDVRGHRRAAADRRRAAADRGPRGLRAHARGAHQRQDRLHLVSTQ